MVVRQASRSAFKLPPVKFRHGAHASAQNEGVSVITSPVSHEKNKTQRPDRERRRGKGEERKQREKKSFKQSQARHEKSSLASREDPSTSSDAESQVHPKSNKYTTKPKIKFTTKTPSQSVEDTLASLGIDVKGEIIFGIFPVLLALQANRRTIHQLIYKSESGNTSAKIRDLLNVAENQGVPTMSLKPSQFKQIFQGDQVHQGVCCDASPLPFVVLDEDDPEEEGEDGHGEQEEDGVKDARHQREGEKDIQQSKESMNQQGEDNSQGEEEKERRVTGEMKHQREEERESRDKGEANQYITQAEGMKKQSQQENLQAGTERRQKLWLYLDQIQDPMNFGTVLRSAYFMGVDRVLTSEACRYRVEHVNVFAGTSSRNKLQAQEDNHHYLT